MKLHYTTMVMIHRRSSMSMNSQCLLLQLRSIIVSCY